MKNLNGGTEIPDEAIREELARILRSSLFAQSDRLGRFLRFTIEHALAGNGEALKEYLIGTEVYDRKPPYHPSEDSIVRSEARRLRGKLKEYYESEGKNDPIFIYYRTGSYAPVFRAKGAFAAEAGSEPPANELFIEGQGIAIAVLPFVDASRSELSAVCAQGITDELIHELMRTDGLRVTAASSVAQLLSQSLDVPALAQKLGVQIVFEGSVREEKNRIRVTSRIVNADGFQIWSQRFEAEADADGIFQFAEQVASALISRTGPQQSAVVKRKASAGPSILAVYPAILGAEALLDEGTAEDTQAALARFEEVARAAPGYARPYCGIAQAHCEAALRGAPDSAARVELAVKAAKRAIELDPPIISAHSWLSVALALQWNWTAAENSFEYAMGLGIYAGNYRQYALFLAALGRFDEARHSLKKAQRIDPFSYRQKVAYAKFLFIARRYEEAVAHFSEPQYGRLPVESRLYLGLMLALLGRREDALRMAQEAQESAGPHPVVMGFVAEISAISGDAESARRIAAEMNRAAAKAGISKFRKALLSAALGDGDGALSLLASAHKEREAEMVWMARDPRFDGIREDKRFARIRDRVMGGE